MLAPWGRIIGAVLSGIGLLGFPIGTILNGYFLYLLLGEKGSTVFSERYKRVIADTPHVKYIPWASIVLLVILGLLIVVLAVAARM